MKYNSCLPFVPGASLVRSGGIVPSTTCHCYASLVAIILVLLLSALLFILQEIEASIIEILVFLYPCYSLAV